MKENNPTFPLELLPKMSQQAPSDPAIVSRIKQLIVNVFGNKGIVVGEISHVVSPSVVRFEFKLDKTYNLEQIRLYECDLNEALSEFGPIRLIAPVLWKEIIAIEVLRSDRQLVMLREVLESREFQESNAELPIALGLSTENKPVIADLQTMPQLLIGGAVGMGKSVLLNSIIISLLYRKSPYDVKFILIDPKKIEFEYYAKLKEQYLVNIEGIDEAIITSPKNAITALNSLCSEMTKRYELLSKTCCRSSREYSQKMKGGKQSTTDGYKPMPYIIVVIDEFADLIKADGRTVEITLGRLAQKGRPVGIHVIFATQQTSTKVLTGTLRANIPVRIAFKVQTFADSKTILDMSGTQSLLDKGDMLVSKDGIISRVQGAFIDEHDIEKVCDWITHNNSDCKPYILPAQSIKKNKQEEFDILFHEAVIMGDIDNKIDWNDYYISGDIEEIRRITRAFGSFDIGVDDIICTLSTTNTNYVTTGKGIGSKRVLMALKQAIDKLPVSLHDIDRMIVNVWTGKGNCRPIRMPEMGAMQDYLLDILPELALFWGVAVDPTLNEDIKVTLIAVNKYNLC